jgi:regulator of sigma E protease
VKTWDDVLAAGKSLDAKPVALVVRGDDGVERTLSVVPRRPLDPANVDVLVETLVEEENRADGFADAVGRGVRRTWSEVRNVFRTIARFFSGDISFSKNVQGPLSITKFSSGAVDAGLGAFLALLAYISVNLAVLNILPVPILDGGTLLILGIEAITRRKVPEAWIARFQLIGFGLLLLLMFFALRNDMKNLFGF